MTEIDFNQAYGVPAIGYGFDGAIEAARADATPATDITEDAVT